MHAAFASHNHYALIEVFKRWQLGSITQLFAATFRVFVVPSV
jgi:hypothetical protein